MNGAAAEQVEAGQQATSLVGFELPPLFRCERLHASITQKQCGINRSNGHASCIGCKGLTGVVNIKVEKREGEVGGKPKPGICVACKREMLIMAKGLCGTCYLRSRSAAKKETQVKSVLVHSVCSSEGCCEEPVFGKDTCGLCQLEAKELSPSPPPRSVLEVPPLEKRSGLEALLAPDGLLVSIPTTLALRLVEQKVSVTNVLEVITLLLDGKLRRIE